MKIINVVGARPNFMKIAPLMAAYRDFANIDPVLVHTGQHYDERMSDLFFRQLEIPAPDINLEVGSASHAVQTAQIMMSFEKVVIEHKPDAVLVVGDVNSTIACGLVASKLGIKLIHVEAGLRSGDRTMPEEINRLCTDAISDILFCTSENAVVNLRNEGVAAEKIFFVGNVMIDTLMKNRAKADESGILDKLSLTARGYAVLTAHRPSNVDDASVLSGLLDALDVILEDMPIVFPIHPRTLKSLESTGLAGRVEAMEGLTLVEPLGYLDFMKLMCEARLVLTDSGGIQEETTILNVPCLTLRNNTERPVTAELGTNQIVGTDPQKILAGYKRIAGGELTESARPPLWDGSAATRIAQILSDKL